MEEDDTFDTYMMGVSNRIDKLSDKDKNTLASLAGSKVGNVLISVLGPTMAILGEGIQPVKKRGLAARK
jgi:hypothetical protein|tara:strand:- start:28 stop:234 length:207 start_codon:yes stop_codon:yes gene_type:complete